MLSKLSTITLNSAALLAALSAPVAAQTLPPEHQSPLEQLKAEFKTECAKQQQNGEVGLDRFKTLAEINNRIETLLINEGTSVVKLNNSERFYVTDQVYKVGMQVDLTINDKVAKRFPTCIRENLELMSN